MAGLRMAGSLQTLQEGAGTMAVGLIIALFAVAPVAVALWAGRFADRHGFHRPMELAMSLTMSAGALAWLSTAVPGVGHVVLLALAALLSGAGANIGVIAMQRTAGVVARDSTERVRLFSWMAAAPSLANVVGPVAAGFLIDGVGFGAAYAAMLLMPLATLWAVRVVPRHVGRPAAVADDRGERPSALSLLGLPGLKRLLFVNWLLATCWDVHAFAVPVLGHGFGFSASVIGLVLGTFTLSVTLIRLAIPAIAHRLQERTVVTASMLATMVLYAAYPFASSPWAMAALASMLGITLGCGQPMIMSTLHRLTPDGRHGESLAFRSMAINFSSAVMPLAFGLAGTVVGAGALFWVVGGAVGAGAWVARRLPVA